MAFDAHAGTNKLARTLHKRIKSMSDSPLVLDFGKIESDYGLVTNTFPVKIPQGDYTVCRHVTGISSGLPEVVTAGTNTAMDRIRILYRFRAVSREPRSCCVGAE